MIERRRSRRQLSPVRTGWLLLVLVVFTFSIGTAVHNHGLFGVDGGAEKVSQSKYTCPACVFDGKPVTQMTAAVIVGSTGHFAVDVPVDRSFEMLLGETASSRAPPAV